ncbi:hypothetical protein Vafri_5465 [Volvox africanus]|uniref:SBP-type domain-containing protein n=1 Tax=Volvox africanus TaxID=51714 RepID=A0A8J4AXA8_9CHLO|nr:hypothetical protein Vafri_5465 [Volvox africanus]
MLMSRPPVGALSKAQRLVCQIQGCNRNLQNSKLYYQRFKLCEDHLKAPAISIDGVLSRLCQQCGRFHELSAFEGKKRTCRSQLDRIRKAKELRKRNAASSDSPERDVDGEADAEDTMAVDATTAARRRGAVGGSSGAGYGGRGAVTTATGKWTSTNSRSSEHTSSGSANAGQQQGSGGGGAAVTAASVGNDAGGSRRGQEGKPRCMQDANMRRRSREDAGAVERHDGTNRSAAPGAAGHANGGPGTLMLSDAAPYDHQQDVTFDVARGYGSSLERGVGRGGGSSASGGGGPVMAGLDEATGGTTATALVVPQLAGGSSTFPDTATRDHHRHPAHSQPQHMSEQQQLLLQLQRVQQEKDAQKQLMRAAAGLPPGGQDLGQRPGAGPSQLWGGGGCGGADQQVIDQSQGTAGSSWGLNQHVSASSGNSWLLTLPARKAQQEFGSIRSGWSSDLQADAGPGPGLAAATAAAFLPGASTLASAAAMNTKAATVYGDYKQGLPDLDIGRGISGFGRLADGLTPTSGLCPAPKRPHNSHHHHNLQQQHNQQQHNQQQQQLQLLQHQGSAAAGLTCDALERKAPECTTLANEGELQGLLEELASTGLDGEPRGIATLMSCGSTVPVGKLAAAAAQKPTAMHGAVERGGVAAAGSGLLMPPSRAVDDAAGIAGNRFFPMGHLPHQDGQQISSGPAASNQGRASSPIAQQLQTQPTATAAPQPAPSRLTISEGITLAASYALGMAGGSSKDHPQNKVWPEAKLISRSAVGTTDNGLMAIYDAMMHQGSDLEMETVTDAAGSLQQATQHQHQQQQQQQQQQLLLQRLRAEPEQRPHHLMQQQQQEQQHMQNFQQQQNLQQQAGLRMSAIQHSRQQQQPPQQQQQQQQGVNPWAQASGTTGRALSGAPQGPSRPGTLLGHDGSGGSGGGLGGSGGIGSGGGSGGAGGPPYLVRDHMSRVTLKLMNCLPDELPHTLRANLQRWVANRAAAEVLQACMRPGTI